mgnify:CR=1 FL=1
MVFGFAQRHLKELFAKARKTKPCIIFVDEIDSIGRVRSEGEQESLRRLKTELLRQLDGVGTDNAGVTFIAATNVRLPIALVVLWLLRVPICTS